MSNGLSKTLAEVRRLMPSQGPLEFFVHHNTFHELESMDFKDALLKGKLLYGGKVLKGTKEYQKDYNEALISDKALSQVISEFLAQNRLKDQGLEEICFQLLQHSSFDHPPSELNNTFLMELGEKQYIKNGYYQTSLLKNCGINIDEIISPAIFRFFSNYFDQGSAYWKMPAREQGLFESFKDCFSYSFWTATSWEKQLSRNIKNLRSFNPEQIIGHCLKDLNLEPKFFQEYLTDLAYRYKGWGGLIISFEKHPEWNKKSDIKSSHAEFLAILVLCEFSFLKSLDQRKKDFLKKEVPTKHYQPIYNSSFLKFAEEAYVNQTSQLSIEAFNKLLLKLSDFERQFLWHRAFEESFYFEFLSSFQQLQQKEQSEILEPKLQVLCCIDDREESFRRYIEELSPQFQTFGVAGHFGLDIRYKGVFNAHYRALCPDIVRPSKMVTEKVNQGSEARKIYRLWGSFLWMQSLSSKTLVRGILFQFLTGFVAIFSLSIDILSPLLAAKIRHRFKNRLDQRLRTHLEYDDELNGGMNFSEKLTYARNLLRTIGLVDNFAPVVAVLGHGSHSLNNPHEAAYDCGACGGGRGAPNARLISEILNSSEIRAFLSKEGILIPDTTLFIGGYHNTCSEEVLFFDLPESEKVEEAVKNIRKAARVDAMERCRRFEDVPLSVDVKEAYDHCFARASNYMQPRPEYGHATNALCIVGPRENYRNLFLDRRAFLTSYNPSIDTEKSEILKNILSAVGPVCSGINLEYYFSFMDNEVYGCGTKLPHNVTSLVGVMNGYQSDLLLGLSWQMIEIHEPYRLMLLVFAKKKNISCLLNEIASFNRLVNNNWIHLSVFDPEEKILYRYRSGEFVIFDSSDTIETSYLDSYQAFSQTRKSCRLGILKGN